MFLNLELTCVYEYQLKERQTGKSGLFNSRIVETGDRQCTAGDIYIDETGTERNVGTQR